MPLILNIDTATEIASVCISLKGDPLALVKNRSQREHGSFIHTAVKEVLEQAQCSLEDLDALAVTSGPGSYTGLRVGMSAAKGFCYALSKPLITENTLKVMAQAAIDFLGVDDRDVLLCPMIDARRMEVFTALYNHSLETVLSPKALVLAAGTFDNYLTYKKIVFFGSGIKKFKDLGESSNSSFMEIEFDAANLGKLADELFNQKRFSSVSYSQPEYFKDFYSTQS